METKTKNSDHSITQDRDDGLGCTQESALETNTRAKKLRKAVAFEELTNHYATRMPHVHQTLSVTRPLPPFTSRSSSNTRTSDVTASSTSNRLARNKGVKKATCFVPTPHQYPGTLFIFSFLCGIFIIE